MIPHNIPSHEIDRSINWYMSRINEDQCRIQELKSIKLSRQRAAKHAQNMNSIAAMFFDPDYVDMDFKTLRDIIYQRLDCDYKRAGDTALIVMSWAKNEGRKLRNEQICTLYDSGEYKIVDLCKKYKLSRNMVSRIVNERKKTRMFK